MSHFTVLVIGENPEEQLAPYQENNTGNCPQELLEFNETETEYRKEYEEGTIEKIVMPDGQLVSRYDEEFRIDKNSFGTGTHTHEVPEHLEKRETPFKKLYPNFEEFMKDHHGYTERDDKTGKYGYWENPNAKWDWYELGGRWTGFFKVKPHVEDAVIGRPGLMTEPAESGFADQLRKSEIDIEYMRNETARKAMEEYDFADLLVGHLEKNLTWEQVCEKFNENMQEAKEFYWEQPRCAVWKAEKDKDLRAFPLGWDSSPEDFHESREKYIQRAKDGTLVTFAVVKDGKWYERGKMGWWAFVSDEKDADEWNAQVSKMFDELPEDTMMSLYDCHI
jgi:hypothetical protein